MSTLVSKSVEYSYSIQDITHLVKVLIISAPKDLEIINIDKEENAGFIYTISVLTEPGIPNEILPTPSDLIFIIGNGGIGRLGHLENTTFIDSEKNSFFRKLEVNILEVLMIAGDSGHFKS